MIEEPLWDRIHKKYSQQDWVDKPSLFAESILEYLPMQGRILDLGAGQGQDSRFFATKGYTVESTDYSQEALRINKENNSNNHINNISESLLDISKPFPFPDSSFDVVYSHLAIHYFSTDITRSVFDEIKRVLKPQGVVALLVNSVYDPEFGVGEKLEDELFEVQPGFIKRYFSIEAMRMFAAEFKELLLDEAGETYKDKAIGVNNLIRFVGIKE